jgi:hypothetical protein
MRLSYAAGAILVLGLAVQVPVEVHAGAVGSRSKAVAVPEKKYSSSV